LEQGILPIRSAETASLQVAPAGENALARGVRGSNERPFVPMVIQCPGGLSDLDANGHACQYRYKRHWPIMQNRKLINCDYCSNG
jgi:hypothetical protein